MKSLLFVMVYYGSHISEYSPLGLKKTSSGNENLICLKVTNLNFIHYIFT